MAGSGIEGGLRKLKSFKERLVIWEKIIPSQYFHRPRGLVRHFQTWSGIFEATVNVRFDGTDARTPGAKYPDGHVYFKVHHLFGAEWM
jgi:hypothetical protein